MAPVNNYEMDGWPKVIQTLDAYMAERKVWMAWSDVDTFISNLAASDGLYPYNPSSGATVWKVKIEKMPGSPLTASGGTGMVIYDAAVVWLWYSTSAPRYWSNLFYVESVEPYREFHSVSHLDYEGGSALQWGSDDAELSEPVGVVLSGYVYCLSFHRVTTIPANFFDAAGYCNSAAVISYSLGKTFAAQTLLHMDPRASRQIVLGGANRWALHYRWIYRGMNSATWNHKWRPDGGGKWDTVEDSNGVQAIFHPTVAFSTLVP
jgi:hypothetical protein